MTEHSKQDNRHSPNVRVHPPIIVTTHFAIPREELYLEYQQRVLCWL
jgi:hypothetical protein